MKCILVWIASFELYALRCLVRVIVIIIYLFGVRLVVDGGDDFEDNGGINGI